jgi:hypothetical protein
MATAPAASSQDLRTRRIGESDVVHVAGDADHREPNCGLARGQIDLMAERRFARPELARRGLVDHDHRRRVRTVAAGELAAGQHRNSHQRKVAGGREIESADERFAFGGIRSARNVKTLAIGAAAERQIRDERGRLHTGHRLQTLQRRIQILRSRRQRREARLRQEHVEDQHAGWLEARMCRTQREEGLQQRARAGQQCQGESGFEDDQCIP